MKRITALLLAALLLALPVIGCAEQTAYPKEENTGWNKDSYPWIIRTPYAAWYVSKTDIELLGEEAYYEGLYATLDDAEADFADARAALAGFIPDEIQPIDIYTDFCNKAEASESFDAFYRELGNYIKLFSGWNIARIALQHEYVHYLTVHCARPRTEFGLWVEGIAEYVSNFICRNRLARSENMGFEIAGYPPVMWDLAWDEAENCIDPLKLYLGLGTLAANGGLVGQRYYAVMHEMLVRTDEMDQNLKPEELSLFEASGMIAYLVDEYGKDTVFGNWDLDPYSMDTVYGKGFSELYRDWAAWSEAQCRRLGIMVP